MAPTSTPDRATVISDWEAAFGGRPPAYLSVRFMTKAVEYDRQCKRAGGLTSSTRRALQQVASGKPIETLPLNPARTGTQFVREWNGRTYQVEAVKDGFELDGRVWSSLSAIAKHITGTSWSGPRFFGLAKTSSPAR